MHNVRTDKNTWSAGGRRLRRGIAAAAVIAGTTAGLATVAGPAEAARHNPCATARAAFRAAMNEARFWIGAADTLAAAGNVDMANAANAEAEYYLGQAQGALDDMASDC